MNLWCLPCVPEGAASAPKATRVIFFNFRPDRAREITRTFVDPELHRL